MINKENLFYGKCPKCHRNGILRFFRVGKIQNFRLECKYCKSTFKVNRFFSIIMYFSVFIIELIFIKIYKRIFNNAEFPTLFVIITVFIATILINVFSPLEECGNINK